MKTQLLKISSSVACLVFLMSAKNCEQPVTEERVLKKNVRVMQMNASSFLDNAGFNFSETAQSQLSGVLFEQKYFYERTVYPVLVSNNEGRSRLSVNKASTDQMQKWFPHESKLEIELSQDSSCFVTRPQHFLAGKINALETYGGGSLQFGFSQTAAPALPVSGHIKIDKMRMDLSFHAYDPWTQQGIGSINTEAIKNDYAAGFGVDIGIFHIGPEFYRTTGMAETTLKGLKKGLGELGDFLLAQPGQDWQTRVLYSRDNYVLLLGGQELGIKVGDKFKIYNQVHNWIGEPCGASSILGGSTIVSDANDPWIVEVEDAGNQMAKARVLNPKENVSINTGALVKLHQFVQLPEVAKK